MNNGQLSDRVAVVTGGSVGIGRAIVRRFAEEGARVAFLYRSQTNEAEKTIEQTLAFNTMVKAFKCSVCDASSVTEIFNEIQDEFGDIDILVNNAGITQDNFFMMLSESQWDNVINVNLKGMFLCAKAVIKSMLSRQYGRIVNMSSISALMGREGQTNYAATKGGIISFTKSLAREVAKYKITVNAIAPGLIETQMTKKIQREVLKKAIQEIPMGRIGQPEEVAEAVLFLASERASFITGTVLNVTGGQI